MEDSDCFKALTAQFGGETKAGGGDHFIIEELLDFPNEEEEEDDGVSAGGDGGLEAATGNSTDSSAVTAVESCNSSFSGELIDAGISGDLCEPTEELAELEWLSNFVEESFSSEDTDKLQLITGIKSLTGASSLTSSPETLNSSEPGEIPSSAGELTVQQPTPFFLESSIVPIKVRTKRPRSAPANWSARKKNPLLVICPNTCDVAATSSSESDSILLNPNTIKKAPKPVKKPDPGSARAPLIAAPDGRKCLHCATDKTPQWRTGPMGPQTLCNACGVRYKSGRLVPEYRPAASPTFVLSKHSNSHRKVLELRRQKEMQQHFASPLMLPGSDIYARGDVRPTEMTGEDEQFLIHQRLGPELDLRQLI